MDKEYLYLEETLTRHMLSLDSIETNGNEELRSKRKESIDSINRYLSMLEERVAQVRFLKLSKSERNSLNVTGKGCSKNKLHQTKYLHFSGPSTPFVPDPRFQSDSGKNNQLSGLIRN